MKSSPGFSRQLRGALVAAAFVALSGCYSKATGYHGKFTFAYASGVDVENFVKPVAPGAKLEVVAFANGTETELVITGATSSRPGVLAVESVGKRSVVLKGGEPGVADVEITARDEAGKVLVDRMFLHVARPTVHGIEHACTEGREAVYVSGEPLDIFHGLATSDRRSVIGYGYTPVRIEPASALELVAQPQEWPIYSYKARGVHPRVSVRSTIDDGELSLRVVARGDLKEAALRCSSDCRVFEGGSLYVGAHVRLGETPVCSQNALTKARSLTPEICSVTAKLEDGDGESNRDQLALVKGLKFGVCKFELTLPELDGGKGVVLPGEARVGRMEFPGDKAAREPVAAASAGAAPAPRAAPWRRQAYAALAMTVLWLAPRLIGLAGMAWSRRRQARAALATRSLAR